MSQVRPPPVSIVQSVSPHTATVSEIHSLQSTVQRELVTIPAAYCTIQTRSGPIESCVQG